MSIYIKNLSDFTANVSPDQLSSEINANVDVTPNCYYVQSVMSNVNILFNSSLSQNEKNIVDILVSEHIPYIDTNTGAQVGLEGNIVGTTDSQILINKILDGDFNNISNIEDGNIKSGAGINTTKLANGTINNTEFQYLNGVTSSIQTQINNKANSAHTHSTSDIATGILPVSRGGTGSSNLANGFILTGGGTGSITATLESPSGSIVGTTDSQTLTNKTLTSTTNNISAKSLLSSTTSINIYSASAPTSGQVLTATGPNSATWQNSGGGGSVYGSEYNYSESDGVTTTTSNSFTTKTLFTTGSLPSGTYKISWSSEINNNSTSFFSGGVVRVRVTVGVTLLCDCRKEFTDSSDWISVSGFRDLILSGSQTITMSFNRESQGTSSIRRARIQLIRIS